MTLKELELEIDRLRSRPLVLVCQTSKGNTRLMSVQECAETGSAFLYIAKDDLDALLEQELGYFR